VILHLTNDNYKITDVLLAGHDLNFNATSWLQIFLLFCFVLLLFNIKWPSWWWSYDSWIYICNQCISLLTLWIRIPLRGVIIMR